MLNWADVAEMIGYLTALLSVSVSYVSQIQQQHYSDFLRQNEQLRQSLFSPFFGKIVMIIVAFCLVRFFIYILIKQKRDLRENAFAYGYIVFLGLSSEMLLWYLHRMVFIGAPLLVVGILMVFFVEVSRVYRKEEV
ncbi:MAG: hypothetical protein JXO44_02400 [Clostridia bacterium]|nr:hypothetical protein [Clostridia bacterium]